MKHLFAPGAARVLEQLAGTRLLVALDFDGTLAPIVADRERARMRGPTARLLRRVAARYPTMVVSGRGQRDVAARLRGARLRHVIGNHGVEPGASGDLRRFAAEVGQAWVLLEQQLEHVRGVDLEDKRYSLAIHYRRARGKRRARAAILAAIQALPMAMRIVPGKAVLNLVPAGAPHKGDAVLRARDAEGADTILYLGDDVTDEDVFQLDQPGRVTSVRIGRSGTSAATYFVRGQRDVDRVLAALAAAR